MSLIYKILQRIGGENEQILWQGSSTKNEAVYYYLKVNCAKLKMCTINSTATAKNIKQRVINKPMVRKMQSYKTVHSSKRRQEKRGKGTKEI